MKLGGVVAPEKLSKYCMQIMAVCFLFNIYLCSRKRAISKGNDITFQVFGAGIVTQKLDAGMNEAW